MLEAGTNRVVILSNRVSPTSPLEPNTPLTYTNDLDIASDGTIYFTDSVDVNPHRNAQHSNSVHHIISIKGLPGYYDTVKGWALGMLQVCWAGLGSQWHAAGACASLSRSVNRCTGQMTLARGRGVPGLTVGLQRIFYAVVHLFKALCIQ